MSDWDYINERMGGHDDEGLPNFMNEPDFSDNSYYNKEQSTYVKSAPVEIKLTPSKYLDSDGRYIRAKLLNNKLSSSEIDLEIMHDKYNDNDSLALEVYNQGVMIGYIQKYDSNINIDNFCFHDGVLDDIIIEWEDGSFIIYKSQEAIRREQLKQEEADKEYEIKKREKEDKEKKRLVQLKKDKIEKDKQLEKIIHKSIENYKKNISDQPFLFSEFRASVDKVLYTMNFDDSTLLSRYKLNKSYRKLNKSVTESAILFHELPILSLLMRNKNKNTTNIVFNTKDVIDKINKIEKIYLLTKDGKAETDKLKKEEIVKEKKRNETKKENKIKREKENNRKQRVEKIGKSLVHLMWLIPLIITIIFSLYYGSLGAGLGYSLLSSFYIEPILMFLLWINGFLLKENQ